MTRKQRAAIMLDITKVDAVLAALKHVNNSCRIDGCYDAVFYHDDARDVDICFKHYMLIMALMEGA